MLIEDYKKLNGWLNVRVNPKENETLYDFSAFEDGIRHTLTEAHELYKEYINNQPERSKREDLIERKCDICERIFLADIDDKDDDVCRTCLREY